MAVKAVSGKVLRLERLAAEKTQAELADALGCGRYQIILTERGVATPEFAEQYRAALKRLVAG